MEKDHFMNVKKKALWPTTEKVQKKHNLSHEKGMLITDDDIAPEKTSTNTHKNIRIYLTLFCKMIAMRKNGP